MAVMAHTTIVNSLKFAKDQLDDVTRKGIK